MKTIIECVRERVIRGARTFMVKVKAHRGETLNTWQDKGVKRVSTWSKAVRRAMLNGEAEFQRQKVLNRVAGNCKKEFLRTTDTEVARIRQVACTGVKCD